MVTEVKGVLFSGLDNAEDILGSGPSEGETGVGVVLGGEPSETGSVRPKDIEESIVVRVRMTS